MIFIAAAMFALGPRATLCRLAILHRSLKDSIGNGPSDARNFELLAYVLILSRL